VRIPRWEGVVEEFSTLWVLTKSWHKVRCSLFTHPLGAEIRAVIDDELWRSEARRDGLELLDLGAEWYGQFKAKGWQ
jgi:hypothetical protein